MPSSTAGGRITCPGAGAGGRWKLQHAALPRPWPNTAPPNEITCPRNTLRAMPAAAPRRPPAGPPPGRAQATSSGDVLVRVVVVGPAQQQREPGCRRRRPGRGRTARRPGSAPPGPHGSASIATLPTPRRRARRPPGCSRSASPNIRCRNPVSPASSCSRPGPASQASRPGLHVHVVVARPGSGRPPAGWRRPAPRCSRSSPLDRLVIGARGNHRPADQAPGHPGNVGKLRPVVRSPR